MEKAITEFTVKLAAYGRESARMTGMTEFKALAVYLLFLHIQPFLDLLFHDKLLPFSLHFLLFLPFFKHTLLRNTTGGTQKQDGDY